MPHNRDSELTDQYDLYETETVLVKDFSADGHILDIGGGGEGIIGLLKGAQVVAVDLRKSELEEAPDGPLKIVADARDLPFLDETFNVATTFFSMMYIRRRAELRRVFAEAYRVLRPAGRFFLWDAVVERPAQTDKDAYIAFVRILVGDREIHTGYGQPWPDERRDPGSTSPWPKRQDSRQLWRKRAVDSSSSNSAGPAEGLLAGPTPRLARLKVPA